MRFLKYLINLFLFPSDEFIGIDEDGKKFRIKNKDVSDYIGNPDYVHALFNHRRKALVHISQYRKNNLSFVKFNKVNPPEVSKVVMHLREGADSHLFRGIYFEIATRGDMRHIIVHHSPGGGLSPNEIDEIVKKEPYKEIL